MSAEAVEARRNYQREYRRKNQEKINAKRREWRADNRDKVRRYNQRYWERRAGKVQNIRASYADYNISPQRLNELIGIVRSGQHDDLVLSAARKADESAAEHIIMSVKENASYEALEARQAAGKIERIALGRSDFYGARRLFFHYLDIVLR
jgi:chromatin segregation and condensation protein Rec8/ScpA/Scc1 (kleisin family)